MQRVVQNAARRNSLVLIVEHSSFALAAVFGGVVLLLLLGTQILNWAWLVLLGLVGVVVTTIRVREHMVSSYRVAQTLDRRLRLSDSLSTAWFLLQKPRGYRDAFAEAQIERAEEAARSIEPASVFPFVWRRAWALTGALAAVAFGLFALRYLVTSSLDLRQALIPNPFLLPAEVFERIERWIQPETRGNQMASHGMTPGLRRGDGLQKDENNREGKPGDQAGTKSNGEQAAKGSLGSGKIPANQKQREEAGNRVSNPEQTGTASKDGQQNATAPNQQAAAENRSTDQAREQDSHQQSPTGLLDRMKDAFSGLMAKARPQEQSQKNADREQGQPEHKAGEQSGQNNSQSQQAEQNSRSSQSSQQGENREKSGQGQQEAQASEKSPGAQSRASDESASRKGTDAQSGIGRQDGEKSLKEAEQLRAMGKLDEIIGKRSSTVTGDMTVETHSGNQQLQTQYSGRIGQHADLGGEIDRNEVPVALQRYVREYMEQVRKQANNQ